MKATMEPTSEIVTVDGVQARVWNGVTEKGIRFTALVYRIAVHKDDDSLEFDRELQEQPAPRSANRAFDARMF